MNQQMRPSRGRPNQSHLLGSTQPPSSCGREDVTWLRCSDQIGVAALVLVGLLLLAATWVRQGGPWGGLVHLEQTPPEAVAFQVDLNEAAWPELTLLPGISETLARRIVHSRQEEGEFQRPSDLLRVSGIGPKKLAAIQPYLLPLAAGGPSVDQPGADGAVPVERAQ